MKTVKGILILLCISSFTLPVSGETEGNGFDFSFSLEIGAEVFNEIDDSGDPVALAYQTVIFKPDFSLGKFGIGLYIPFHFRFLENGFEFREEDWTIQDGESFGDKYLPMFHYIRYGYPGDPLYVKLGSIENGTLGNGFIMGNYSNARFLPEKRIFGADFNLDGMLFGFPYIGLETFAGNIVALDVVGARVYTRPIFALDTPVLRNLEIGASIAMDRVPDYHYDFQIGDASEVTMYGFDFRQPLLSGPAIDLALFGDVVFQGSSKGGMVGTGGRFISIIPWTIQLRFIGKNFVPEYFDSSYDLFREYKYYIYEELMDIDAYKAWYASAGFSLLGDLLVFNFAMQGILGTPEEITQYPQINAVLLVKEGVLPGFFFDASYEKRMIEDLEDLLSPENAVIGARVNYRAGSAIITLAYNLRYNPDPIPGEDSWEISTSLSTSISF